MLASITRNWWILLVRGIFAVAFGIMAFGWPGITLLSLVLVFAIYAIIDGITSIAVGMAGGVRAPWWQMVLVGVISVVAGVLAFAWPGVTAIALLAIIAAWSIVRGIAEIAAAIRFRALIENEWLLILAGACSILFGVILIARPGVGVLAVLWIIGAYAIIFGLVMIALSLKLHSLHSSLVHNHEEGLHPA